MVMIGVGGDARKKRKGKMNNLNGPRSNVHLS